MAKWLCRKCGAANYVAAAQAAQGSRVFACHACNTKHVLNVQVDVRVARVQTLEESDREEEALDRIRRFRLLEVSTDKGATWRQRKVNVMDANPRTSALSPGDLIRVPGRASALLITLEDGRLSTEDPQELVGA